MRWNSNDLKGCESLTPGAFNSGASDWVPLLILRIIRQDRTPASLYIICRVIRMEITHRHLSALSTIADFIQMFLQLVHQEGYAGIRASDSPATEPRVISGYHDRRRRQGHRDERAIAWRSPMANMAAGTIIVLFWEIVQTC